MASIILVMEDPTGKDLRTFYWSSLQPIDAWLRSKFPNWIRITCGNLVAFLAQDMKIGAVVPLVGTTFTAAIENENEDFFARASIFTAEI